MKRATKRIYAIILAAVLVIASLPVYSIAASAKENTVYEFLTDRDSLSDSRLTVHEGVSWNSSENAASFNGSSSAYIELNESPFSNVTVDTGFTVSVDIKRNSSNGNYARILDFSDGSTRNYFAVNAGSDTSDAFVRYCIFAKYNDSEIRYYANNATGQHAQASNTIYSYRNFLENESAGVWHNVKISMMKSGDKGRLYYYFDNVLYYIYEVSNYSDYINSFKNYTNFYIGKSIWPDPYLNGYMKNFRITNSVSDETRELFHFTFDNGKELRDELSSNQFVIGHTWNDMPYQQFGDHIWLRDGWIYASAPGTIRDSRYNKNWKIDFSFSMADSGLGANRLEHVLSITSKAGIDGNYDCGESFGLSTNGKLYFNTTDFNNPFGDTGVNLKDYFFGDGNESRQKPMKLSYAYHNGVISVLINDELKFSADVSGNASFFENINSLTIGGRGGSAGNWIDIFDLDAYSYQKNEDASNYLVSQHLVDNITTDEAGNHNLSASGRGAEWVTQEDYPVAHFLGEDSSDSSIKNNYLYLSKSDIRNILSGVNENTGVTISFFAKRNSDSWQRFFELTNANSGFSGDGSNNFLYFAANGNMNVRTDGSEPEGVPNITDVNNWHVWTMTVLQGAIIAYRDGVKVGTRATTRLSPSWFNDLVNDCMLLIGAATPNWDNGANFWMRDFRLYNIALDDSQVKAVYSETGKLMLAKELESVAADYENKVKTGNIYTNAKNAYNAYVYANRIKDAVNYGETDVPGSVVSDAVNNLRTQTNNMQVWSRSFSVPDGTKEKWASNDVHGASYNLNEVYHNVLWSGGIGVAAPGENDYSYASAIGTEVNTYGGTNKNSIRPVIYRESAVMVYTGKSGDDPYMPVMFRCRGWKGGSGTFKQRHRAVYIDSNGQGMYLNNKWRGTDGQLNFLYSWFYHGEKEVYFTNDGSHYNEVSSSGSGHKEFCYANVLRFNGAGQFGSNQYSKTVNGITWGFIYSNDNDTSNASQTATEGVRAGDKPNESAYDPSNQPIYVINYSAVINALNNASVFAKNNISSYKEGGLADFFAKYDEATAFDPNSYGGNDWSSNTSTKVSSCANGIKDVVDNLNNVSKASDIYNSLRTEMGSDHSGYNSAKSDYHSSNIDETYTASSITAFKEKYEAAAAEMARLVDNPYKTSLGNVYSALSSAHHSLVRRADFSELLDAYEQRMAYSDSEIMNIFTSESVEAFRNALVNNTRYAHYSEELQKDTASSEQNAINAEKEFILSGASSYLDPTKSLEPLNTAYEKADALLMNMNNQPAVYSSSQLETLISAIEESDKYLNASSIEKREFGTKSHGDEIDSAVDLINSEYDSIAELETVDLSAYNAVLENAQALDTDAYDYDSRELERDIRTVKKFVYGSPLTYTNLSGSTSTINVIKNGVSEDNINAAVSIMQSSLSTHTRMYSIKIAEGKVSEINGVTFNGGTHRYDSETNTYYATYNTKLTLNSDSDDTAWYMDFDSETAERGEQFQGIGKRFSTNVIGNINVYVRSSEDGNKLTIARTYSDNNSKPIQLVSYVNGSYTLPNAPALPYYTFDGYTIDGESYEEGDVIHVLDDTYVTANYTADNKAEFAVNIEGEQKSAAKSYNDKVSLEGNADTYAWLELVKSSNGLKYRPFFVGKDANFYVSESITLKPVTEEEFISEGYKLPSINIRQDGAYVTATEEIRKVTFNGQIVTDGSTAIAEYGILLGKATENGSLTANDVRLENIGTSENYKLSRFKSTKDVGAHQFTIGVNGLSGEVIYKGYISYKTVSGSLVTVYTDPITETL